jgi:hypothetical protein
VWKGIVFSVERGGGGVEGGRRGEAPVPEKDTEVVMVA